MSVRKSQAQRIYRYADVLGRTRYGGPSSRDVVGGGCWCQEARRCGRSKDNMNEGKPSEVMSDGLTRLEVGVGGEDAET